MSAQPSSRPYRRLGAISRRHWPVVASAAALAMFAVAAALRIRAMQGFDVPLILAANRFAHRSPNLDHAVQALARFDLFQGLPLMALAYGAFAATSEARARLHLAVGSVAATAAAELGRVM